MTELKRRNVFRVAVFYGVTSWLILQAIDVLSEILTLPDWLGKGVLVLLLVGFFPALIFSWVYEMTPEGLKLEKDVVRDNSITQLTAKKLDVAVILLLLPAIGLLLYQQFRPQTQGPAQIAEAPGQTVESEPPENAEPTVDQRSIAVLPFANRSNREEDLFFTDGMHDDLLTQLAKVASLKVISRTSVMRYRDTEMSIPEIAGQLGVANILEGGIQRAGDQIRINVQLIETATDEHLWAETYDRLMTTENLFAIQSEITRNIIDAMKATLTPEEAQRIDERPTESLEAFQAYMRGQQLLPLRTVPAIEEGRTYYEKALELDPGFQQARVGLANALHLLNEYAGWPAEDSLDPAMDLVTEALAASPDLAEGYMVQGELYRHAREFKLAEAAFERSLDLAPGNPTTHQWYGMLLAMQDRSEKAFSLMRRAHELDPMSPIIHLNYAIIPFQLGEDEKSLAEFDRIKLLHPQFASTYSYESWVHSTHGDPVATLAAMTKVVELDPESTRVAWHCGSYIDLGLMAEAEACFENSPVKETLDYRYSRAYFHLLKDDRESAEQDLDWILDQEQGKPWGAGASIALRLGRFEQARELYGIRHPDWFGDELPAPDPTLDVGDLVEVAEMLILQGDQDAAKELARLALASIEGLHRNRGATAFGNVDLRAHILLGDRESALKALEDIAEVNLLSNWQEYRVDSIYESIRHDLRFTAALDRLEKAAAEARERAREEGLL